MQENEVVARAGDGEILGDRVGAFGAVQAGIFVRSASEARALRQALSDGLDHSRSHASTSLINKWLDEVEGTLRRAREEQWTGWESVHDPRSAIRAATLSNEVE